VTPSDPPGDGRAHRRGALEAVLLVAVEPVTTARLAAGLSWSELAVLTLLQALREEYAAERRGWALREVAGGWRLYTAEEYVDDVLRFLVDGQSSRLSSAALETLAVIAYRQPVSRGRIAAVRGVAVDGVVRTLLARGLIEEAGHDETSGALLYRTTSVFLERLGLRSLTDLPELAPLLPEVEEVAAEEGSISP